MDEIGGDPGASFPANGLSGLFDSLDRLIQHFGQRFGIIGAIRAQGLLSSRGLLLALVGLLLLPLVLMGVNGLLRRANRVEANFRGEQIPQSFGLAIGAWAGVMMGLNAWLFAVQRGESLFWLTGVTGFGLLGFIDDTWGTKRIKGLRGHFRAAFRERTITTGFVKAVGGGLLALLLGWRLYPVSAALALLAAALIALSANAVNLLDLRPGRAGGVFMLVAFPLCALMLFSGEAGTPLLLFVLIPTIPVWQRDAKAQVMMGDTGSNLLGATLGIALATSPITVPFRLLMLSLLIGLHILAERVSLTKLIEQKPLLRKLDRLTGVR